MPALADASARTRTGTALSKRKRPDDSSQNPPLLAAAIQDICDVLESYDTVPSILNHPLPASSHEDSSAPKSKRPKLVDAKQPHTILTKARSHQYATFSDLIKDVEQSSSDVVSASEPTLQNGDNGDAATDLSTLDHDRLDANVGVLKKALTSLIAREHRNAIKHPSANGADSEADGKTHDATDEAGPADAEDESAMTVLTLFGSAQGPRQLFSSSQKPAPRQQSKDAGQVDPSLAATVASRLPLDDQKLPYQISSTKILSTKPRDTLPSNRQQLKFHDMFKPRSNLPSLTPPKPSKRTATRDSTVTWSREPSHAPANKVGYTNEKLPTGHWLGYNGVSSSHEPVSPEAKRKQRARTLSTSEGGAEASEMARAAHAQAKEDALFRSVYSSFAPSIDDSDAVVPEDVKDEVWWDRFGEWYYHQMFDVSPLHAEEEMEQTAMDLTDDAQEDQALQDAVDNFEPISMEEDAASDESMESDVEAPKVLSDVSDLLESLLSHQRIRNSSLRPNAGQPSSTLSSAPPGPSPEEVKVYESLRSKLASLVSRLPPYTLSKVRGDQLSDLMVSRQILLEGASYQGVMEEDQASRLAAATALNSALGTQPGARQAAVARSSNATPAARSGQAYGTGANSGRPTPAAQRAPLSAWQTPAQQYASSASQRAGYGQQTGYNRPLMSGYGQRPGSAQQPNGTGMNYSGQAQYQQRTQREQNSRASYSFGGAAPFANSPGTTGPQQMYQQALQRPAGGYYPQSPVGSQGRMPALARAPSRAQHSPMAAAASPPAMQGMGAAAGSSGSRPHTPATPSQGRVQTPKGAAASP